MKTKIIFLVLLFATAASGQQTGSVFISSVTPPSASGAVTSSGLTMSTGTILGRTTSGTGAIEQISIGTSLSLSSGSLNAIQDIRTSAAPTFSGINTSSGSVTTQLGAPAGTIGRLTLLASSVNMRVDADSGNGHGWTGTVSNHPLTLGANDTVGLTLNTNGTAVFASSITTAAPTAGSAGAWKMGTSVSGVALAVSTTSGVRINVGGSDVTLAVLTTNP
jgi:hypothetical protein